MSTVVILGAQWGDEGKGKLVDVLTEDARVVARYQGGHNAGHTVVIKDETFILHLIPSGILHKGKLCIIGNGTVVDPFALIKEMDGLIKRGVNPKGRLLLSSTAHLIMPYHMAVEAAMEATKGDNKIGTTGRGIGPAYTDKMARTGIRVGDLMRPELFKERLRKNLEHKELVLRGVYGLSEPSVKKSDLNKIFKDYMKCAERLGPFIADTDIIVNNAIDEGKNVLFEGAQGTLLDIDHGTYPFVTSSSAGAGGVCTGLGVGPTKVDKVIGVVKAYTTRVGGGPFPTELDDELGIHIRERGGEYGATTGRPRRCGWLDMVALRHSARINGLTGIAVTKLDILDDLDELKICTAYKHNGKTLREFPKDADVLAEVKPVYVTVPGWKAKTSGVTKYPKLPLNARKYLKTVEKLLGVKIAMISTGQKRNELITLKPQF